MKKVIQVLVLALMCVLSLNTIANTNKYRIMWRANPATTMVVGWNQVSGSGATVYYGTTDYGTNWSSYPSSKTVDRSVSHKGMSNQFARLTGLQPNTAYYFVIRDSEGTSQRFWFKTAPNVNTERLSFIAGGDSRNNQTPRRNANKLVAKLKPHAVLFGGDMTDSNTNAEWIEWFDDWQYTISANGKMTPIVAARGNHEGSNADIYNLFDTPSSDVYYALTFGGNLIRSYTLNTEMSITGNQTTWLNNDLASNSNVIWKSAQYHKPMRPHQSSKSEGNTQYSSWATPFYNNNVRLVIECDAHTVKTTWPVKPSTAGGSDEGFIRDDATGTVYAGEGCWGAPLRSNNDNKTWTRNSGMFNQFKWIFVDANKIEMRTIKVDNADQVGTVSDNNIFAIPSNLDIWSPSNGSVVTITNSGVAPTVNITAPSNGSQYNTNDVVNITASAADADGSVTQVEFFVNGNSIGVDGSAPYSRNYTIPTNGSYNLTAIAKDNDNNTTESNPITISAGQVSLSKSWSISNGADDVEEHGSNGSIYNNSSDIELVYDNHNSAGNQTIGLLFRNIDIPQGATITNAYVQFTCDETNSGTTNLTIKAEDVNNAADISTSAYNVSNRTFTSASTNWSPAAWNTVGQAGSNQATPNISSIIQEVVNRGGWNSGNKILISITGTGERTTESYNGSPSQAPKLYVDYTVGGGSTPQNGAPSINLTAPSNGTDYDNLAAITITANASDSDGSIANVQFFVNGNSIGSDATAPYSRNYTIPSWGTYVLTAIATDNDGATTTSSSRTITATQASSGGQTFNTSSKVSTGSDDAEEATSGTMYLTSSDLELVYDSYQSAGNQLVGIRFQGLNIPQGAIINSAYIQFTCDETKNNSGSLVIRGEDANNSSTFTTSNNNISNRPTTSASVNWSPASWNSVGQAGTAQQTPDISNIIQEIVDRGAWSSSSSLSIIISGTGRRVAESYNGSSSSAPELVVEYTVFGSALTSVSQLEDKPLAVNVFPNPVGNILHVSATDKNNSNITLLVYNLEGKIVLSEILNSGAIKTLDMSILANGTYILSFEGESGKHVQKVLKY